MNHFWKYARRLLQFRSLLMLAALGAIIDAAALSGGMASLMWIIDQLLKPDMSARLLLQKQLSDPRVTAIIGDHSDLANVVPVDPYQGFAFCLAFIFVLAIIGSIGRYIHQYNIITAVLRTVMNIRKEMFSRVVRLPMAVISAEGVNDKLSRIIRDSAQLSGGLNTLLGRAVRDVMQGIVFLGIAMVIDPYLTMIFLGGAPVVGVLIRKFGKKIRRATKKALVGYGVMLGKMNEALLSLRVVKVHEAEGYERRRFAAINRDVLRQEMKSRTAKAMSAPLIELIAMLGVITVTLTAAWYVFRQGQDPHDLIKVLIPLGAAGAALKPLTNMHNDLQEASAAAERLDETLVLPMEPSGRVAASVRRLPRHRSSVVFENIHFTYPTSSEPALRGIDLVVPHGSVCAIVGGNGSGKSTLLSLLPRLLEPQVGRVLIDGVDIAPVALRSLRGQIAMVTQDTVLFEGTIADNITYGQRHVGRARVIEAARRAHAHDFISELPAGYDAPIGEWGSRLSGGQRQRIAIARAILRDPAILILDEATSQIDAESEANITQALAEFVTNRTTFVIAHRLSTVVNADMIVVMTAGRIVDIGTHSQLLASSDLYRILCRTQLHAEVGA
jgi:ABC-type multidrug transport system fused ATPase/permease subunit